MTRSHDSINFDLKQMPSVWLHPDHFICTQFIKLQKVTPMNRLRFFISSVSSRHTGHLYPESIPNMQMQLGCTFLLAGLPYQELSLFPGAPFYHLLEWPALQIWCRACAECWKFPWLRAWIITRPSQAWSVPARGVPPDIIGEGEVSWNERTTMC